MTDPAPEIVPRPASSRVVDVFLGYLRAEGVSVVFGVPGGLLHPFFEAIDEADDLRLVCTKHEQGAAFMADGFARASGQLAVCASTAGPGATNLLTGVAVAYSDGVPMLVVTGQPPTPMLGKGAAQEGSREDLDIVDMFRPVTKYSTMVTSSQHLPLHLRRALRHALSGRPGPVHLNLPVDLWSQPLEEDWYDPATYRPATRNFDRKAVQRAALELLGAERPVILAGSGARASDARSQLRALAELLPCLVATSPRAKGLFPEDHRLSLGVLGHAGDERARVTIFGDEVDVLLTVGCALDETTTFSWRPEFMPTRALLQLDIDGDQVGRNYPVHLPLVGDAQAILVELIYHVHRAIRSGEQPRSAWYSARPEAEPRPALSAAPVAARAPSEAAGLVSPVRWREALNLKLSDDAIVFSDVGGHMLFNIRHLRLRERQQFALNMGFASMGHGTCAPIGAALGAPHRRVIAIVGDGCFTMNGMELLTAVEYQIGVIWIVENNNMHGITWHGSKTVGSGRPLDCVRLERPLNIAGIAQAMGLQAWCVRSVEEFIAALDEAEGCRGPCLIEILVDPDVAPPLIDRAKTINLGNDDR